MRIVSWYDNEWGFSNRMVDTGRRMGTLLASARFRWQDRELKTMVSRVIPVAPIRSRHFRRDRRSGAPQDHPGPVPPFRGGSDAARGADHRKPLARTWNAAGLYVDFGARQPAGVRATRDNGQEPVGRVSENTELCPCRRQCADTGWNALAEHLRADAVRAFYLSVSPALLRHHCRTSERAWPRDARQPDRGGKTFRA